MKIIAIYDNDGKTFDCYSVYLDEVNSNGHHTVLGMSDHPCHSLGYAQHATGIPGPHNGRKIKKSDLPVDCQDLLKNLNYV